ncbi:uncharacterized protein LOC126902796 [Daktulosphaira vitifoliae]|uniref:uncharacterized protein LOC126902796 n=1 Tax=Daktulosphaira vitifoliae TaxID=58002 RepID=UPI0021A9CBB0|nr:uncharacterized protein LOC126902796 [Daktulosphaira vitifoliae]
MSKRPRTEPPYNEDDFWGDDLTCDEVNTINNIETLASQSHYPNPMNDTNHFNIEALQVKNQIKDGEIKNLKMKIMQLEVQLSHMKQEKDDKYISMKKMIDCKDTELKFQKQELTALQNKMKEMNMNVSKILPQKNTSFSCMKTGSNSKLLHDASEHIKKTASTQTYLKESSDINSFNELENKRNKVYNKLKKHLYPDLFGCQMLISGTKNSSSIQECHIILTKLIVLDNYNDIQAFILIKQLFQNLNEIIISNINSLKMPQDSADFIEREKDLIYNYLNYNQKTSKKVYSSFDMHFSRLLDCISVLTTITDIVPKVVFDDSDNTFKTILNFLQIIGAQSRTFEFVLLLEVLVKFLANLCSINWKILESKQLEMFNITKEIILCRPPLEVIKQLINLFSKSTLYPGFTNNLCQLSTEKTFILSESMSTFTTGTCVLRVFCLQLELLKHEYHIIIDFLHYVHILLNNKFVPKWMYKCPSKICDCTSSFIQLIIHFLYIIFNAYEKKKELFKYDELKLVEEVIENSYCILYRLGKLDDDFRSHIGKCKGRYDVIVGKIQKIELCNTNKFLVKELKRIEFKSLPNSQCSSNLNFEIFNIDIPKCTQNSQCQFDEPNKQNNKEKFP